MEIYLAHNHYDKAHLEEVKSDMLKMGAPTIRVIDMGGDEYAAIEGCHRLRAAAELGLVPELELLDYDAVSELDVTDKALGLDLDNPGMTIADLVGDYHRRASVEF